MTEPPIELRIHSGAGSSGFTAPCAGGRLISDWPLSPIASPAPPPPPRRGADPAHWHLDYRGPGLAQGRIQEIQAESSPPWRRVTFEDGERFLVCAEGWLARIGGERTPDAGSLERALGAPLALLLETRGVYLLHASAIGSGDGAVALVGASGEGKSTLARAAFEAGISRLADDQLPVRLGNAPVALPHFPQLKLAPSEWYPESAPQALPLRAVVAFRPAPDLRRTTLDRLSGAAACLRLVRATVAARLFGKAGLEAHLAGAAAAAERVGVYDLNFPSGPDGLRSALAALADLA
jgi:hypothetical protein